MKDEHEATLRRILGQAWHGLSFVRRDALVVALRSAATQAREAAFDEAANIAESHHDASVDAEPAWNNASMRIAAAIRAAKERKP